MDEKTPLLANEKLNWNSINTLKSNFLSKLPEKLKKNLDPETPLHLHVSKTSALSQGISICIFIAYHVKEKKTSLSSSTLIISDQLWFCFLLVYYYTT